MGSAKEMARRGWQMNHHPPIILPSDPLAARQETLWVSRDGRCSFDEQTARQWGATHVPCVECGAPALKPLRRCPLHQDEHEKKCYISRASVEWDGESPIYSDALDKYYNSIDECLDELEDGQKLLDLRLLACEKAFYSEISIDRWDDEMPEDDDANELSKLIDEFNNKIRLIQAGYKITKYRIDTTEWEDHA